MGIFDKIKNAIFGGEAQAAPVTEAAAAPKMEPAQRPAAPSAAPSVTPTTAPAIATVDIVPILDAAVKESGQKLDWRHSIVDLMKAVGMDASLSECKELAAEARIFGRHRRFRQNEYVSSQGAHEEAVRKWRQGSRRSDGLRQPLPTSRLWTSRDFL